MLPRCNEGVNRRIKHTPKIVFENVIAALTLAEQFLNSTKNVDEFNNLLKNSHRSLGNDVIFWRAQEYGRAKEAISATGDGLGKDVIKHFLPAHAVPGAETLQNAIDSHYAERRQTAFERWMGCHSQEEIAKEIGYAQKAVSEFLESLQAIPNGTDAEKYNLSENPEFTAEPKRERQEAEARRFRRFPPPPMGGASAAEIVQKSYILTLKLYTWRLKKVVQSGLAATERAEGRILPDNV